MFPVGMSRAATWWGKTVLIIFYLPQTSVPLLPTIKSMWELLWERKKN
jgi:hypothetical protein